MAVCQTGSRPYSHGFIADRICGLSLCPALCNHCYPCKGNCKWVSLLNLYIDDLSPSESCSGSIETHRQPRLLWLPLCLSYCMASADEDILLFNESSSCRLIWVVFTIPAALRLCSSSRPSLVLGLFPPAHGFCLAPLVYFSLLRINAPWENCVSLPLHRNMFVMCMPCGLLVRKSQRPLSK